MVLLCLGIFSLTFFVYYHFVVTEELNIQVVLGGWDSHVLHTELDGTRNVLFGIV